MTTKINGIIFGKKGLRDEQGNYYPAWYSRFVKISDGIECITVYAKKLGKGLPASLNPQNDSDSMTDYFESDKIRFNAGSPEFNALEQFASKGGA